MSHTAQSNAPQAAAPRERRHAPDSVFDESTQSADATTQGPSLSTLQMLPQDAAAAASWHTRGKKTRRGLSVDSLAEAARAGMRRVHDDMAKFAPDYTGNTWRAWLLVVACAVALLSWHAITVLSDASLPPLQAWMMIGIAVIARIFPVEIRGARSDHVVSDAIIACIALLHGAPLATLAIAAASSVETHMRTRRRAVQLLNASLHAITLFALLQAFEAIYTQIGKLVPNPTALMIGRAAGVVAVLMLQLAVYKALQQWFFYSKASSLGASRRSTRGLLRINGADGASGVLACTLYLLICALKIQTAGQVALFFATLMITLPLHSRQRSASMQIQRLRMAAMELAARQANTSLQRVMVNEARFFSAFEDAAVGMAIVDPFGKILIANRALKLLLKENNLVSHDVRRYVHREDVSILAAQINALVASVTGQSVEGADQVNKVVDLRCLTSDDQIVVVALHSGVFREPARQLAKHSGSAADSGSGLRLIVQMQDVTLTHMAAARMRQYAYFDSLTRLRNRTFFTICLERAYEEARKDPSKSFALMYLDFDRFKQINDLHGHAAGDKFLALIAERLRNGVRPGDIVSRLGGDEFAILVEGAANKDAVLALGERILTSLREPYLIGGVTVRSSASIGVALFANEHADVSSMMRAADTAMYRAKSAGRDQLVLFGDDLRAELDERLMIERDLASTIANGGLALAFQPIFTLDDSRVVSLEALLRWTHPSLGAINPLKIVTIAEETGLMPELTRWVIRASTEQARLLRRAGYGDVSVHINVSGSDVSRGDFVAGVQEIIQSSRVDARQLVIEITESTLMRQLEQCSVSLSRLREMGVGVSIDDFGTGYSSLAYLGKLPFTSLKIDRSFVRDLSHESSAVEVIKLVVAMARSLGKKVIAEGIETQEQADLLRELGCARGQGYLVSQPIAQSNLLTWLSNRQMPARGAEITSADFSQAVEPPAHEDRNHRTSAVGSTRLNAAASCPTSAAAPTAGNSGSFETTRAMRQPTGLPTLDASFVIEDTEPA